ncbi:MAG: LacI family DNA-binding transcriptional regulator [Caulobacteraceae bacterium]|nr:LacI family DNA-binding transcriptional regulator [Caulobacteraceae bacterium]
MASVTIYDVANHAGVSIKTVSRVMNAEPNVRPATREKVAAAAEALGYSPNLSARSLAGSKSFVLTAFVDAALTLDHWSSERGTDYLTRIQLGATLPCREAGYHLFLELIDHDTPRMRQEVSSLLAALKPDGVILTPPSSDNEIVLDLLKKSGTPFVRLAPERSLPGGLRMRLDDRGAAARMTKALIDLGHRRIAFIAGEPRYGASRARREGFLTAMTDQGLTVEPTWMQDGDFTFQSGFDAARRLIGLRERPTAIFASNDDMALGCLAAASEAGLNIPTDLSVAGFDDSTGSRFSRPTLSTVRQPLVEMAGAAARALVNGQVPADCDTDAAPDQFPPFHLVMRQSTAPPPKA